MAIKQLRKSQIAEIDTGIAFLVNEIKVHWAVEECASCLKLIGLYEDFDHIYMVLDY